MNLEMKQFIRSGIIKELGATTFAVYMVIQAYTDIQGVSYPSLQTIADIIGVSIRTVQRAMNKLEEEGLIQKQLVRKGTTIHSIYSIVDDGVSKQENPQQEEPKEEEPKEEEPKEIDNESQQKEPQQKEPQQKEPQQKEPQQEKPKEDSKKLLEEKPRKYGNSKDFIQRFCELYYQYYGVNFNPTWGRDGAMVKNKLLNNYTDEELDAILEITFRDYQKRWANRQYPRPTLGGVSTFIANQALAIWQEEQKKQAKIEEAEEIDLDKYFKQTF